MKSFFNDHFVTVHAECIGRVIFNVSYLFYCSCKKTVKGKRDCFCFQWLFLLLLAARASSVFNQTQFIKITIFLYSFLWKYFITSRNPALQTFLWVKVQYNTVTKVFKSIHYAYRFKLYHVSLYWIIIIIIYVLMWKQLVMVERG